MHTVTLTLDGVITDTVSVSLEDALAFTKFMAAKQVLAADSAPMKRRGRRAAGTARTDDTPDAGTATADASDD